MSFETVLYFIAFFILYSFAGWLLESVSKSVIEKKFVNSGFLTGPLCPIYGFGAVIMMLCLSFLKDKPVLLFFAAFFIAVGYWWRTAEWELDKWWLWLLAMTIFIGNLVLSSIIPYSSFIVNVTPSTLPIYVLPAIIGTMMTFEFCRWVQPYLKGWGKKFWLFMGNESIFIMALHFVAFKIVLLGEIKIYHLPIEKLYDFPIIYDEVHVWSVILCTILGVVLPLVVAWIWKKRVKCKV